MCHAPWGFASTLAQESFRLTVRLKTVRPARCRRDRISAMSPRMTRNFVVVACLFLALFALAEIDWQRVQRGLAPSPKAAAPQSAPIGAGLRPLEASPNPSTPQPPVPLSNPGTGGEANADMPDATHFVTNMAISPERPAFAFGISGGRELFLWGDRPLDPGVLDVVLLPSGETRPIRAGRFQMDTGSWNDTSYCVEDGTLGGTRYEVPGTSLEVNKTYLVASKEFLAGREPLRVGKLSASLPAGISAKLEGLKKRKVQKSWPLADLGGKARLYWVIFEPVEGKRGLASLVFIAGEILATQDSLGSTDGGQSWRVGEDVENAGDAFTILFACETEDGLEWAVSWMAEEGEDLSYVVQRGETLKDMQGTDLYRGTAPH